MSFYFAYGSNTNPIHMNEYCKNIVPIEIGLLQHFKLCFQKPYTMNDSYCDIISSENSYMFGLIYLINTEDEYALDKKEHLGLVYDKISIQVITEDNKIYNCWTYKMINPSSDKAKPCIRYYNLVRDGYLLNHIPLGQLYEALLNTL